MMSHLTYPGCPLFHYTGVVIWAFLTLVGIVCLCSLTVRLWKRHVSVRFHNLFYIVFGFFPSRKGWGVSSYEIRNRIPRWRYRYFTRGRGKGHFGRLACRVMVARAWKERKKNRK